MKKVYLLSLYIALCSIAASAKYDKQEWEKKKPFDYLKLYREYRDAEKLNEKNPYEKLTEYSNDELQNKIVEEKYLHELSLKNTYDRALVKQKLLNEFKDQAFMFELFITNFELDPNLKDFENARNIYLNTGKIDETKDCDKECVDSALAAFEYMRSIPEPMVEFLSKNFRHISDIKETIAFKKLLPQAYFERRQGGNFNPHSHYTLKNIDVLFQAMAILVKKLDAILDDGDVLIVPGNTGQYLALGLQAYSTKRVAIIPLAISGAPGSRTREEGSAWEWARNILTPDGLENYIKYVKSKLSQALKDSKGKKIYILDIVSGGYGVSFLINCIEKLGFEDLDVNIINIDQTFAKANNRMLIDRYDIDFQDLAKSKEIISGISDRQVATWFDTINHTYRLMPDFPAYLWDDWGANDPDKFVPSDEAKKFAKDIQEYFKELRN